VDQTGCLKKFDRKNSKLELLIRDLDAEKLVVMNIAAGDF